MSKRRANDGGSVDSVALIEEEQKEELQDTFNPSKLLGT